MPSMAFQLKVPSPVSTHSGRPSKIALEKEFSKARWELLLEYFGPLSYKSSLRPLRIQGYRAMNYPPPTAITPAFQRPLDHLSPARSIRGGGHGFPRQLRVGVMGYLKVLVILGNELSVVWSNRHLWKVPREPGENWRCRKTQRSLG